ncbi:MAG: MerR family transcriptional regulator [Lachnospiraceae bacterium]|nr:MerR family transcriptional regulator [Lachnospiraceae bacterium]
MEEKRPFEDDRLYTVSQVTKACGISRSTILRMERDNLVVPANTNTDNNYRYYDLFNVFQIQQINYLKELGLKKSEILKYYDTNGDITEPLQILENKLMLLRQSVELLRLRKSEEENMIISFYDFPEQICYTRKAKSSGPADTYRIMYDLCQEAVTKGYELLSSMPLFGINMRTDFLKGDFSEKDFDYICCVPLAPERAPEEAEVIPACHAVSLLYHGSYEHPEKPFLALGKYVSENDLIPAGPLRVVGIVAPYVGKMISPENYVTRLVLPIE